MKKEILSNVITALVTAALLGMVGYFAGIFEKGQAAIDKEQIRQVLQEEMQTDAGVTYGAALQQIGLDVNTNATKLDTLTTEVDNIEEALIDLAGGN